MAPSRCTSFLMGISYAAVALLAVALDSARPADAARPESHSRPKSAAQPRDDGDEEHKKFDPQQRFDAVKGKADEITGKVKTMEESAQAAQKAAGEVKSHFNKYTEQIQNLHQTLNELDKKRLLYAVELFDHFKSHEHQRIGPMLNGYKPLREDRYSLHNDKDDKKFEEKFNAANKDAQRTIEEAEKEGSDGGGGGASPPAGGGGE
mmetsp:Transcript_19427/g.51938  ORF Transcript_19427/g.51938 Transcript_19427/m.51938 type:complete len:206 (-) Transcript_19427:19-636(-)